MIDFRPIHSKSLVKNPPDLATRSKALNNFDIWRVISNLLNAPDSRLFNFADLRTVTATPNRIAEASHNLAILTA